MRNADFMTDFLGGYDLEKMSWGEIQGRTYLTQPTANPTLPLRTGRQFIAESIRQKLESRPVRKVRRPTDLTELTQQIEARIHQAWAENTWKTYSSEWNQFRVYAAQLPPDLPLELQLMCFIEDGITGNPEQPGFSIRTGLQYLRHLTSLMHNMGIELGNLRMYRRGLKRTGGLRPNQAPPLSRETAMQIIANEPLAIAAQFALLWYTASRHPDFSEVVRSDVTIRPSVENNIRSMSVTVEFATHKGDPFRLGSANVFEVRGYPMQVLHQYLQGKFPDDKLIVMSYQQLLDLLKKYGDELSEHSIKRGALTVLLTHQTPLQTVQMYAKHRGLQSVLLYVPPAAVAESYGSVVASRSLTGPI